MKPVLLFFIIQFCNCTYSYCQISEFFLSDVTSTVVNHEEGFESIITSDSNLIILGSTFLYGGNVHITKMSFSGTILWSKLIGSSTFGTALFGFDILETIDKGFIIAGTSSSPSGTFVNYNAEIIKLDSIGNIMWTKQIDGGDYESLESIIELNNGDFIMGGTTQSVSGFQQALIIKLDNFGNVMWMKCIENLQAVNKVIKGVGDEYILSGLGGTWSFIIKFDLNDSILFAKQYNLDYPHSFFLFDMIKTKDGGYAMVGSFASPGNSDNIILKLDSLGNIEWKKLIDVSSNDGISGIVESDNKSFIVISDTSYFANYPSEGGGYIFKVDSMGDLLWETLIEDSTHLYSIINYPNNLFFVTGTTKYSTFAKIFGAVVDQSGLKCGTMNNVISTLSDSVMYSFSLIPDIQPISFPKFPDGISMVSTCLLTVLCNDLPLLIPAPEVPEPFSLYPNPSSSGVYFMSQINSDYKLKSIEITDITGKIIFSDNSDISNTIDLSLQTNGFFIYQILTSDDQIFRGRLILQR